MDFYRREGMFIDKTMMSKFELIPGSIYDNPMLYDVLFSVSCRQEIRFLEKMAKGKNLSIFEPACGTGRLLWRLAKKGHRVVGLDLNPVAVDYCNQRMLKHGLSASAIVGDMTDFSLRSLKERKLFDLAFNFVSSFLHLTTEESAAAHLRCIASVLRRGGIYLLGLHLQPKGKPHCDSEHWATSRGLLTIQSELRSIALHPQQRTETVRFRIEAKTPSRKYAVDDLFLFRTYTKAQILHLLKASPFDIVETYNFCCDKPIEITDDTEDVIFVLKR